MTYLYNATPIAAMPIADLKPVIILSHLHASPENLPWMPAVELLAKIRNVCTEVSKNKVMLLRLLELYGGDRGNTVYLCDDRLDRQIMRNLIVILECWSHCVVYRSDRKEMLMLHLNSAHNPYLSTLR